MMQALVSLYFASGFPCEQGCRKHHKSRGGTWIEGHLGKVSSSEI